MEIWIDATYQWACSERHSEIPRLYERSLQKSFILLRGVSWRTSSHTRSGCAIPTKMLVDFTQTSQQHAHKSHLSAVCYAQVIAEIALIVVRWNKIMHDCVLS